MYSVTHTTHADYNYGKDSQHYYLSMKAAKAARSHIYINLLGKRSSSLK